MLTCLLRARSDILKGKKRGILNNQTLLYTLSMHKSSLKSANNLSSEFDIFRVIFT